MKRTLLLCTLVMGVFILTGTPTTSNVQAAPASKKAKATSKRSYPQRETVIFPIRYFRGSRMVNLLRMFVPQSQKRYTKMWYSPALHQILIRAPKSVLKILEEAHQRLDVPQAQFRVGLYFVQPVSAKDSGGFAKSHSGLHSYLQKAYPLQRSYALMHYVMVRVANNEEAKLKATQDSRISAPTISLVLRQTSASSSLVSVRMKIWHHKSFTTTSKNGANTMFITSPWLQTTMFAKAGGYTLVGHSPMRNKKSRNVRVLVVLKVERIDTEEAATSKAQTTPKKTSKATPKKAPKAWGKNEIRSVIRANQRKFRYCYEKELLKKSSLKGRVVVSFQIQPNGTTGKVGLRSSSLKDSKVESCILRVFRRMRFPAPPGGGVVRVNYPLVFSPS
ncbi:MAG: energy transducer TonB [Deltaproteobacteria bacterium]|nr:MAG: energy transducer TonB [Deltaproteobacteria bacterium]